jgi:hypothetical protein
MTKLQKKTFHVYKWVKHLKPPIACIQNFKNSFSQNDGVEYADGLMKQC